MDDDAMIEKVACLPATNEAAPAARRQVDTDHVGRLPILPIDVSRSAIMVTYDRQSLSVDSIKAYDCNERNIFGYIGRWTPMGPFHPGRNFPRPASRVRVAA